MPATRLTLLAVASFAVLGVTAFFVFSKPIDRVTGANFERVHVGMTLGDAICTMGTRKMQRLGAHSEQTTLEVTWWGEGGICFSVTIDEDEVIVDKEVGFFGGFRAPAPEGFLDKIRRWIESAW